MSAARPTDIKLRTASRLLEVTFDDGRKFELPFEYLRVFSPSAEVKGHGGGEGVLQVGKENVGITAVEPVGNYALRLMFDDGHDTGLYSWSLLHDLGALPRALRRGQDLAHLEPPATACITLAHLEPPATACITLAHLEPPATACITIETGFDEALMADSDQKVDFGFEQVARTAKAERVRSVFASVAPKYDLMNDLMSFGAHRLWKRFTLSLTGLRAGHRALDVAGGTGDLAAGMLRQVGKTGCVVLSDVNQRMLELGRDRLLNAGFAGNAQCVLADAERLPFPDNSFDCVTIGFGLRNVTDKPAALQCMHRVLKVGGQLLVLEFSKPQVPGLQPLYDAYSFQVLPRLGQLVAHTAASYRYLAESIRMHPDQETLLGMLNDAGFSQARYHNLAGGIVAVHRGYKI